jgi:hypothetical protein
MPRASSDQQKEADYHRKVGHIEDTRANPTYADTDEVDHDPIVDQPVQPVR